MSLPPFFVVVILFCFLSFLFVCLFVVDVVCRRECYLVECYKNKNKRHSYTILAVFALPLRTYFDL